MYFWAILGHVDQNLYLITYSKLQKAQRSIDDIDKRVLEISNKAHIYYSNRELSPYMENLRESIDEAIKKTEDLMKVLQCEEIYRYKNHSYVGSS